MCTQFLFQFPYLFGLVFNLHIFLSDIGLQISNFTLKILFSLFHFFSEKENLLLFLLDGFFKVKLPLIFIFYCQLQLFLLILFRQNFTCENLYPTFEIFIRFTEVLHFFLTVQQLLVELNNVRVQFRTSWIQLVNNFFVFVNSVSVFINLNLKAFFFFQEEKTINWELLTNSFWAHFLRIELDLRFAQPSSHPWKIFL